MNRLAILSLALLVVAMPVAAAKQLRCGAIVAETADPQKKTIPVFAATKTLDVVVLVQFKNDDAKELADGDHVAEVRFIGPQGFLYESRAVPLTGDVLKAGKGKVLPGYRRAVPKHLVKSSKSGNELEARVPLPVAATTIVSSSMYGTWRAEVYLDGATSQCADPALFAIKP